MSHLLGMNFLRHLSQYKWPTNSLFMDTRSAQDVYYFLTVHRRMHHPEAMFHLIFHVHQQDDKCRQTSRKQIIKQKYLQEGEEVHKMRRG